MARSPPEFDTLRTSNSTNLTSCKPSEQSEAIAKKLASVLYLIHAVWTPPKVTIDAQSKAKNSPENPPEPKSGCF